MCAARGRWGLVVVVLLVLAALLVTRRTLLVVGGGSSFTVAPPEEPSGEVEVSGLTTPPEGGWVWFGARRAIANGDETITGAITGGGDVKAYRIDNATRTIVETTTLYDNFLVDDHEPPSFVVRPDGIIMAAFAYHTGPLYVAIGDTPGALPAQADAVNITSQVGTIVEGTYGYTYASILYVPGEDRYYIFARYHDSGLAPHVVYTYSDDDGATWAAHTVVANITYHQIAQTGDRLDFVLSDHPLYGQGDDPDVPTSIYHLWYEAGAWHQSDGTTASLPVANTGATLVYDGDPDRAWLWDVAMGADGKPRVVYVVYEGTFPSGPWHYEWARWTGSAWEAHEVADAGGAFPTAATPEHGNNYAGGIVLDHEDPNRVYYASDAIGGAFQVYVAVTANNGATWSSVALTSDSDRNVRPVSVVGHDGGNVQALFVFGTYADYFTYSQGIKVIGTP